MSGPLAGVRVLEIGHMLAGPYCGLLLADLGAEVIKIEPPEGDIARQIGPHRSGPHNLYFASLNRGKRSLVLDLATDAGQRALHAQAARVQALVCNLRPGVIRRLGLDYATLRAHNPRLVCVALTGYGLDGIDTDLPAYDYIIQALTGVMQLTGEPDGPPVKTGYSAVDNSSGIMAALGLVAKLHEGRGGQVDVALHDVMLSQLNYLAAAWLNAALLAQLLWRKGEMRLDSRNKARLPRIIGAALCLGGALWGGELLLAPWLGGGAEAIRIAALAMLVSGGGAIFFACAILSGGLQLAELRTVFRRG